jgi:hypothetical protein
VTNGRARVAWLLRHLLGDSNTEPPPTHALAGCREVQACRGGVRGPRETEGLNGTKRAQECSDRRMSQTHAMAGPAVHGSGVAERRWWLTRSEALGWEHRGRVLSRLLRGPWISQRQGACSPLRYGQEGEVDG